ncbi:MAG: hypothetical protein GF403_00185 [Candidatus Coatesbacteria bacterium]|nr:hypothetical protein [Candidatus Coatesbacteria bacterium]
MEIEEEEKSVEREGERLVPVEEAWPYPGGDPAYSVTADDEGRYRLERVVPGVYDIYCFDADAEPDFAVAVELAAGETVVRDFTLYPMMEVEKPNIYLYPVETELITVTLGFPQGGEVTVSEPAYESVWRFFADPDGTLREVQELHWDTPDGSGHALEPRPEPIHEYLFYEAAAPDRWQREAGWVVATENLETFFRETLAHIGFYDNEIEDFVEWWVPRLDEAPFYAIYPQFNDTVGAVIELALTPRPHSLIRVFFLIEDIEGPCELLEPLIPAYEAGGFTVHEWGVARDEGRVK